MLNLNRDFRPLESRAGYWPVEDFSLIGDGATCALVGRDGRIRRMCVRQFDSEPPVCSLVDRTRGGHFTIVPEDFPEMRQLYSSDTAILNSELRRRTRVVREKLQSTP